MPSVCVDASLVLMMLLPGDRTGQAKALWREWRQQGRVLVCPPLLYAEVPSVLRSSVFFGRISAQDGDQAFQEFRYLGVQVSPRRDLHVLAWDLAKAHNRPRVYDAMYLAVAQAEGCDLWTADKRLFNAVQLPWVKLVD